MNDPIRVGCEVHGGATGTGGGGVLIVQPWGRGPHARATIRLQLEGSPLSMVVDAARLSAAVSAAELLARVNS